MEIDRETDHDWFVHSGPAGTMLQSLRIPREWLDWGIVRGTVLRNGGDRATPGTDGIAVGYSLLHMTRLREARAYDLLQASFVLPRPYQPGDESEAMQMLERPLQVSVRRVR